MPIVQPRNFFRRDFRFRVPASDAGIGEAAFIGSGSLRLEAGTSYGDVLGSHLQAFVLVLPDQRGVVLEEFRRDFCPRRPQ